MVGETGRRARQHIVNADMRSRDKEMAPSRSTTRSHEARGLLRVASLCGRSDGTSTASIG